MVLASVVLCALTGVGQALPELTVRGMDMVDPQGRKVALKGVNLGNWMVIEPWMVALTEGPGAVSDQYEIEEILSERFGVGEKDRLMDVYRSNWIQEKDFATIGSFGFNVVRLPMNYRQFESDENPYQLKPTAFFWTDRAIEWAGKHGLYVILDMHGAQGGQSPYDHTGRAGQNKLWDDPENSKRLAWLWGELAKRYKDEPVVVAYDVFNEPYGGTHEGQNRVFRKSYASIRKQDPETLIFAHGHTDGFAHYGTNRENGWHNVGYQMHYYPGMFGNGDPTPMTHAKHLQNLEAVAKQAREFGSPFLIGEMNVVFDAAGGGALMRKYYDKHAEFGWMTTMWSYKVINRDGGHGTVSWGMVANKEPFSGINLRTASKEEIEAWMRSLGSMELTVNQGLFDAMTARRAPAVDLPKLPEPRLNAPAEDRLAGWTSTDVGGSLRGGLEALGRGRFALYGGGADIWGGQDQFRFLHRAVDGNFSVSVTIDSVEDVEGYTKAGLMARGGLDANDPHVLFSVFPSGELQMAVRSVKGGQTEGNPGDPVRVTFPVSLQLTRTGSVFTATYRSGEGRWTEFYQRDVRGIPAALQVGAVAASHNNSRLVKVEYQGLRVSPR